MARGMAADRRHDWPFRDEDIGEADGLIEQTTGVAAQVEDDAAQARTHLTLQSAQILDDLLGRVLVKARDLKDRDPAVAQYRHGREDDERALETEAAPLAETGTIHGHLERAQDRATKYVDYVALRAPGGRAPVNRDQPVVGPNASAIGGPTRCHLGNAEFRAGHVERYADPAEAVSGGPLVACNLG